MSHVMSCLQRWCGVWTGVSTQAEPNALNVRVEITAALHGRGYVLHTEMFDPISGALKRGVRLVFACAPGGDVRALVYSTSLGAYTMASTQDDTDVVALSGMTESGLQVNIAYREEEPDCLMFSVIWRPWTASLSKDAIPSMFGRIHRRLPWKPGQPPESRNAV